MWFSELDLGDLGSRTFICFKRFWIYKCSKIILIYLEFYLMGIEHSVIRERKNLPKDDEALIIKRTDFDLPEKYSEVELSDEVLKRISSHEAENLDNFMFVKL